MSEKKAYTQKSTVEKKTKPSARYLRDKDREPVKGIFRFYEVPGGKLSFWFRKWKEDPIERYDLMDNEVCTLPLGVAKHLNKNGFYPVHSYRTDETGKPHMHVGKKVRRFGFQSLEFIDIEDITADGEPMITEPVTIVR